MLLSTGTGLAPFASLIKDPDVYDRFEKVVLVHGCRHVADLSYGEDLVEKLRKDEIFGEMLEGKLDYYPTVTREPFRHHGRITDLITSNKLFDDLGQPPLDIDTDRVMLCGSPGMLAELKDMFEVRELHRRQRQRPRPFRHRKGLRRALVARCKWVSNVKFAPLERNRIPPRVCDYLQIKITSNS